MKTTKWNLAGLVLAVATLAVAPFGPGLMAAKTPAGTLTADQIRQVDSISAYLNGLTTMQGDFLQINPDGSAVEGKFYMRRPGRVRFEYDNPPLTLMSDGVWAMINDREIESVDRYPLRETPLHLLLKKDVNLTNDAQIVDVTAANGLVAVTALEEEGIAQGQLTMVFSEPVLELRYWQVIDAQGDRVTVSLKNVQTGMKLDPELFIPDEKNFFDDDQEWD